MNLKENIALTLTELIVATIVMGIVALGVGAVDVALRQSHHSTSRNAIVAMRTSAIMLHVTKDVEMATGDRADSGIRVDDPVNTTNIWIRREDPTNPSPDPNSYVDDIWVSYTYDSGNHNLYYCTVPNNTTPCTTADQNLGTLANLRATPVFDETLGTQNFYLEVTLTNLFNPLTAADIYDNPQYQLTSRIAPASSSF